jgi:hypothetical protein
MQSNPGGTANLAVLGGTLPPSFGREIFRACWNRLTPALLLPVERRDRVS